MPPRETATAWAGLFICSAIENRIRGQGPEDAFARSLNIFGVGNLALGEKERKEIEEIARARQRTAEFSEVPEPGIPAQTPWYLLPTFFEAVAMVILVFFPVLWW